MWYVPHRTNLTLPFEIQFKNYAAKYRPSTRQNICESLRVIPVKHSSLHPDDISHKFRNMTE